MPHAAFTAAAPAERAASLPLPPATAKLRGDLNLRLAPAPPPVPIASHTGESPPARELAADAAGLRAPTYCPPQGAPTPGPTAPFKPSGIDPLNREPEAKLGPTVQFRPSRTDPSNREPTAKTGVTALFKPSQIDLSNREPGAFPDPDQYIASMNPLTSANPTDAPHTRSQRRRQGIFAADERG
jgi:hypothetical protein